jgi:hypothetical protein
VILPNGETPLTLACLNVHWKVVDFLLGHKDIDINMPNNVQNTPLHMAAYGPALIQYKIRVNRSKWRKYLRKEEDVIPMRGSPEMTTRLLKCDSIDLTIRNSLVSCRVSMQLNLILQFVLSNAAY